MPPQAATHNVLDLHKGVTGNILAGGQLEQMDI